MQISIIKTQGKKKVYRRTYKLWKIFIILFSAKTNAAADSKGCSYVKKKFTDIKMSHAYFHYVHFMCPSSDFFTEFERSLLQKYTQKYAQLTDTHEKSKGLSYYPHGDISKKLRYFSEN